MTVPSTTVQQAGRYDIINVPVTTLRQLNEALDEAPSVFSAAQRAKLAGQARAQVNYDKRQLLIASAIALVVIAVAAAAISWLIAGGCCAR